MKKLIFVYVIIVLLLLTSCERNIPLYKLTKNNQFDIELEDLEASFYNDVWQFESAMQLTNGVFIEADDETINSLCLLVDDFIYSRFYKSYLNIKDGNFETFISSIKDYPNIFDKSYIDLFCQSKVVMNVKSAIILPGGYVKEYKQAKKTYVILVAMVNVMTTGIEHDFFDKYSYLNSGDTPVKVFMCFEKGDSGIKLLAWQENYLSSEVSFDMILQ